MKGLTDQELGQVIDIVKPRSIFFIFDRENGVREDEEVTFLRGVPLFRDAVHLRKTADENLDVQATVNAIKASARKRKFFFVAIEYIDAAQLEQLMHHTAQDPQIELVNAADLVEMAKKHAR